MAELKIIQINIRSLRTNKPLLDTLINKLNIDIILLSETWLKQQFAYSGYNTFVNNRVDGYGGVAILVKKNIIAKTKILNNDVDPIETVAVEIIYKGLTINMCSIYVPPNINNKYLKRQFQTLIDEMSLHKNSIIGGDINAYHPLWNKDDKKNAKGTTIADIICASSFMTINNGKNTRQNLNAHTSSAIDVTFASSDISWRADWDVLESNVGSDHLPILIKIICDNSDTTTNKKHIQYKKLEKTINKTSFDDTKNIEEFEDKLTRLIEEHTKVRKNTKHKDKPWWNLKLTKLWTIKEEKQKIYNRNKTLYTATELKKAVGILRKEIIKSKQIAWDIFTSQINPSTSTKEIYRKVNLFNNKKKKSQNTFIDTAEKYKELLDITYEDNSVHMDAIDKQTNNDVICMEDIAEIISKNRNTAGGMNNINNKILKLLNINQIDQLTKHLTTIWNEQRFPKSWKIVRGVAFPKPNKDETNLKNYRILSLLNVFQKIFNKNIKKGINKHIRKLKLLPEDSYGFREGVGLSEYCVRLAQTIERNKMNNFHSVILTIDIEKAFDKVDTNILLRKLKAMKFENKYIYWIIENIRNRKITIGEGNSMTHKTLSEGLPQGDVLSPMLFNLYTAEMHSLKDNVTDILQYADDFTFILRHKNLTDLNNIASGTMRRIKFKLEELNFKMNIEKCKYMCVNVPRFYNMQVYLFNDIIKKTDHLKILGVTFDEQINFKKHINEMRDNILKNINILKIFNNKKGGAHPKSLINVHNALIKSRSTFAAPCINNNNKNNIKKLQILHNSSLRLCLGMTRSTPITAILGEAAEWPIEYILKMCSIKFMAKHLQRNSQIGMDIRNRNSTSYINEIYDEFPILEEIAIINNCDILNQENLIINCDILNYNSKLFILEKKSLALDTINSYKNTFHVYTDGSKNYNIVGLGIYFEETGEIIHKEYNRNITIKTTELIAIYLAIKLSIVMKKKNIVIFTDSKSSCLSLENYIKNKNRKIKLYEQKIVDLLNKHIEYKIWIQWIPAHIGVDGNERADKAAKVNNLNEETISLNTQIHLPHEEAIEICKQEIHEIWKKEFKERSLTKGAFYEKIIKEPKKQIWFKKKDLNSAQLKQAIRIRSGHTYDKQFLYLMKIEDNNICNTCKSIENAEHIIKHCKKYTLTRTNYTNIVNKSIIELMSSENQLDIQETTAFLKEINYQL